MKKINELIQILPRQLQEELADYRFEESRVGCSDSRVFRLESADYRNNRYLKLQKTRPGESLAYEADLLKWLEGKALVPKLYHYSKANDMEYLLMSEIKGIDASAKGLHEDPANIVRVFAKGLRLLHSIDISDCPYKQTLDIKLQRAYLNVINGLVDELDFQPGNIGKTALEVYKEVIAARPLEQDLVFTHGDYCLPNVIIDNNRLSGFIDMGRGGVADRYQDIALAVRTIRYNLGSEEWVEMFLNEYGLEYVDYEKIRFYILLDELF